MTSLAIVDSHLHLWDPTQLRYSWLTGLVELNRPFLPLDFASAAAEANVDKFIFVEGGCDPNQGLAEVDWVCSLKKTEPRLRGVVAHVPLEAGAGIKNDLEALAGRPLVKGVRRILQEEKDPSFCLQQNFVAGVKLLAGFGWTFDLCVRHEQLGAVTELVRNVPEVEFVLDHFGKPGVRNKVLEPWATNLKALARLPNVSCKVSGLATEADWKKWQVADLRPYFEIALESFGFERVLFGGDWPVATLATTYSRWVETVAKCTGSISDAERAKLFRTNAERIYRV